MTLLQAKKLAHNLNMAGYRDAKAQQFYGAEYHLLVGKLELSDYTAALRVVEGLLVEKKIMVIDPYTNKAMRNRDETARREAMRKVQVILQEINTGIAGKLESMPKERLEELCGFLEGVKGNLQSKFSR